MLQINMEKALYVLKINPWCINEHAYIHILCTYIIPLFEGIFVTDEFKRIIYYLIHATLPKFDLKNNKKM